MDQYIAAKVPFGEYCWQEKKDGLEVVTRFCVMKALTEQGHFCTMFDVALKEHENKVIKCDECVHAPISSIVKNKHTCYNADDIMVEPNVAERQTE